MNEVADGLFDSSEEVSALFLHLTSDLLLVPMAAIAEVTGEDIDIMPLEEPDDRFCGWISWRGLQLRLLSIEVLFGGKQYALTDQARVVVLNAIGPAREKGFYGLVIQGYPQRVDLVDSAEGQPMVKPSDIPGVLCEVVVMGQLALVPDFETLETLSMTEI